MKPDIQRAIELLGDLLSEWKELSLLHCTRKYGVSVKTAIAALEQQNKEPCEFCSRLEEENMECCIAGEDFIEPEFCRMCGKKLTEE